MTYIVTAGYVTVPTAVSGGRAWVDIPRGVDLPGDVPDEDIQRLLSLGYIQERPEPVEEPEPVTKGKRGGGR